MIRRAVIKTFAISGIAITVQNPLWNFSKYVYKMNKTDFDVVIIGGSYAGLSAAMALGRSLKKTLVIDAGKPCNAQTPHAHNFLSQDGNKPGEILKIGKEQLAAYNSVTYHYGFVVNAKKTNAIFSVTTDNEKVFTAKKIIIATGIKDLLPNIQGFSSCWGISVIHCPYCHGYEYKNKKTAIIANGDRAFHLASLVNNLTNNSTIITMGKNNFSDEELKKLKQHNIKINEKEIETIVHTNGQLEKIEFKDGSSENYDCAYADVPFKQSINIAEQLGCKLTENGHIEVNPMQKTTVDGVYACGDNSSRLRALSSAVYTGNLAGAMLNNELTQENF